MAGIRMTGLASGMDTQSLIADLSKAYQTKVDNAKKKQTKAEWKKEAWASLNTKIFNFYNSALTTFKSTGTYNTKKVNGTLSGVKITAGNSAVSGNHKVQVNHAASAQMWTGKAITSNKTAVTGATKISDLVDGFEGSSTFQLNGQEIKIDDTTTLSGLAQQMAEKGINASFDANQGRFYLSSKEAGTGFEIAGMDSGLQGALGLNLTANDEGVVEAREAEIVYNGVTYTQKGNTFNINGLTIEVTAAEEDSKVPQGFSVDIDADAIYDKVKNFAKEYNTLITEMNKLYSAESSRGYEPLTADEKEAMSDDEVEQWEKKIKDSLLRRDSTISTLLSSMRTTLNKSVEYTDAKGDTFKYALSSFGINTGSYTENGQLHIAGNADDASYADQEDLLRAAILSNPDAVVKTFTTLGNEIYSNLQKAMKSSEVSSALTFYNDKQMDSEIKDYKDDVKSLQQKLQDEEDKYYKQFSAMETAMAKLQSQQTYISQLFGG